jgi:hypothetical protein
VGEAEVLGGQGVFPDQVRCKQRGIVCTEHDGNARMPKAAEWVNIEIRNCARAEVA